MAIATPHFSEPQPPLTGVTLALTEAEARAVLAVLDDDENCLRIIRSDHPDVYDVIDVLAEVLD